jgi:hypothetical protein
MKKLHFVSVLSICLFFMLHLQVRAQDKSTSNKPAWVNMMDNPQTNYFETVKSFDKYWEKRILPGEAHEKSEEESEENDRRPFLKKVFQSEAKAEAESFELILEYKQFLKWQREMLPYVQSDGSILSEEQRWEILKAQNANAQ